jgi:hypothetical protein
VILRGHPLPCHDYQLDAVDCLISRISGVANAFAKPMDIDEPVRLLFTSAVLKPTMQVPTLCRTLGQTALADPPSRSSLAKCCDVL